MTDADTVELTKFMRFFLTRSVIYVAEEDVEEWATLLNRAMAVFGYKPGTYASVICERCGDAVCQLQGQPERRLLS
jgi:hypothetical protein